jgi:hypothetical protein
METVLVLQQLLSMEMDSALTLGIYCTRSDCGLFVFAVRFAVRVAVGYALCIPETSAGDFHGTGRSDTTIVAIKTPDLK